MKKWSVFALVVCLLGICAAPAFAQNHQAFRNVQVAEPKIKYVFHGEVRIWEAVFQYRVKADGVVLKEGYKEASVGAPEWGDFVLDFTFPKSQVAGKTLELELYEISLKDGSEINKLIIPLQNIEGNTYQNQIFRQVTGQAKYIYEVQGEARVFEATYQFEVSDGHNVLAQGFGTASIGAPEWGTFQETIEIPRTSVPVNGTLLLELYELNLSDDGPPRLHSYFVPLDQFPW